MIRVTLPATGDKPARTLGIGFGYHTKHEETKASKDARAQAEREAERRGQTPPTHHAVMEPIRYTVCQVFVLNLLNKRDVKLLTEGIARCSSLDNFDKETGRKESLTRAIAKLKTHPNLSKLECEAVWDAYHGRRTPFDLSDFIATFIAENPDVHTADGEKVLEGFGRALLKKVHARV